MALLKLSKLDCKPDYMQSGVGNIIARATKTNSCKTIIQLIKSEGLNISDAEYYTTCRRCNISIPIGIKEFCSTKCEYGS